MKKNLLIAALAAFSLNVAAQTENVKPTVDTYLRLNNDKDHGGETTIELCTSAENAKDFVGYLSFTLSKSASSVKSATLRITTERIKGDRQLNVFPFAADLEGNAKYADYADAIATAKAGEPVGTVKQEGQNGKSVAADEIDSEKYQAITAWQNTIDITEYVKTVSGKQIGLLLARNADANNSNKIFTSEATGIENEKCDFFKSVTADDLTPLLIVEYGEGGEEPEEPVVPEPSTDDEGNMVVTPTVDTYLRLNNDKDHGGETTIELCTSEENAKDFVGYLSFQFTVPEGQQIEKATLRITSERIKGDRQLNIFPFAADLSGNAKYADYADAINAARTAGDTLAIVKLEGQNGKSVAVDEIDAEKYQTIKAWQNTADITEYVKQQNGAIGLLLCRNADANNSNKIFTSEVEGITNEKCDFFKDVTADDLVPQLTLVLSGETAITAVKAQSAEREGIYTLSGQRVEKMTRGIYVVNGKKVIVK